MLNKEEEKKIHEILESGSIGYAYLFDAKARKTLEKVVSLEPENLAALLSAGEKATKVVEVDKKAADQYFGEEDQAVTWAEYRMEI